MPRLLLMLSDRQKADSLIEAAQGLSGWMVDHADDLDEAAQMLGSIEWDIMALDQDTIELIAPLRAQQWRDQLDGVCLCLLVELSMLGYEDRLLGLGAHAIIPMSSQWCGDLAIRYGRLRLMATAWRDFHSLRQAASRAQQREAELRALSQLSQALDRADSVEMIVSRVLQSLTRQDDAQDVVCAYLEWVSPSPEEPALPEGLFSESEAEDLEHGLVLEPSDSLQRQLVIMDQRAGDESLMVCLPPKPHPSWDGLSRQRQPMVFTRRPAAGAFPGLEPLWYRLRRGVISLVPVWGDEALGVVVIAQLDLGRHEALWSVSGLETLASMMARALEHAQHVRESTHAYKSLEAAQDKLVHAEKFAAVGHLAAQIAHEINNPSSFVISNLSVMRDYAHQISAFEQDIEGIVLAKYDDFAPQISQLRQAHDVDFVLEDLDLLVDQSLSGMNRIRHIVQELRYFSHDSGPDLGWVDVERLLEATLALVRHEIKYRARVDLTFSECGPVYSDANKLSQVFLNLLVNASQSLEHGDPERDVISVGTLSYEDYVLVFVEDTGTGIPKSLLTRIFEPFFTTKERGQGTGLGLSISRDILRSLGGDVRVLSEVGNGSRFELLLPRKDRS